MTNRKKNGTVKYDDLTAIKGIREARQQWFRDTMHVCTYDDFAELSVDQIEAGLKAERQFPSRSMIGAWIAQAKALAETVDHPEHSSTPQAAKVPNWEPFASFVIELQHIEGVDGSPLKRTTIHHVETDTNQTWMGVEMDEAMHWMLEQSGLEQWKEKEADQPEPAGHDPSRQTRFSDEMRQVLAKTSALSGTPLPPELSPDSIHEKPQAKPNPPRPSGFSNKLQEILARTQRMTSKTN